MQRIKEKIQFKFDGKLKEFEIDQFIKFIQKEKLHLNDEGNLFIDSGILKLPLFNYQSVAVKFVEQAGGRVLIADEMGLGKSATAIAYSVYKNRKTLIVCPKSVKVHWYREIQKFTGKSACVWSSDGHEGHANATFHIANYDIVDKLSDQLNKLKFDLLVCDEATYLKNRQTIRAKAIFGAQPRKGTKNETKIYPGIQTPEVILLTGTPILNRPIEAFTLLNYLDSQRFSNYFHFTQQYGGWKGEPAKNLDDLHRRTKELVIRRLFSEIRSDLPPKQRNDIHVELAPAERKEYNALLRKLLSAWGSGTPTVGSMPAIQSYLTSKKLPRVIEMIDELFEGGRSVVVFSCYIDPLKALVKHYGKQAVLVEGSMSDKARQVSIDALANGTARLGAFGIRSGGMGIDGIQKTVDVAIFLDFDWVPANHLQAEGRIYRQGQTKQVQVFYMVVEDSIDEYMRDIVINKLEVAEQIVDGKVITKPNNKSVFKEFVQKLRSGLHWEAAIPDAVLAGVDEDDST